MNEIKTKTITTPGGGTVVTVDTRTAMGRAIFDAPIWGDEKEEEGPDRKPDFLDKRLYRVAVSADWHDSPQFHAQVKPAIDEFVEWVERERPDLVLIAGDLFVKSGTLNPLELYYLRTIIDRIRKVCPVIFIKGNHDMGRGVDAVDSLTGAFLHGTSDSPFPDSWIQTKPVVCGVNLNDGRCISVACLPYPDRTSLMAGSTLTGDEADAEASRLIGAWCQSAGRESEQFSGGPTILMYHGTVQGGVEGGEQAFSIDKDIVLKQTDLHPGFTACVAGHLHTPQQVGRMIYTGAPCAHTFQTERIKPGFVELVMSVSHETLPTGPEWIDPNEGAFLSGDYQARYRRIPLKAAIPLLTIDARKALTPETTTTDSLIYYLESRTDDLKGARVRLQAHALPAAIGKINRDAITVAAESFGVESIRVVVEPVLEATVRAPETFDGESGIHQGLSLWLENNDGYMPYRDAIFSVMEEVESGLPLDQKLKVQAIDYKVRRVFWSNWKQWGSENWLDLDAIPGLISVEGPNTAGKSNLAELEAFAFWGALRANLSAGRGRGKLADAVRNGQKVCRVAAEFYANGSEWRIDRTVTLIGDPAQKKAKQSLTLSELKDGRWMARNGGTVDETQDKIAEIVGPLKLYLDTRFCSQFDLDRIYSMSQAELAQAIQAACNTGAYQYREDAVKPLIVKSESDLQTTNALIESQAVAAGRIEALQGQAAQLLTKVQWARDDIKRREDEGRVHAETLQSLLILEREAMTHAGRVQAAASALAAADATQLQAGNQYVQAQAALTTATTALDAQADLPAKLESATKDRTELEAAEAAFGKFLAESDSQVIVLRNRLKELQGKFQSLFAQNVTLAAKYDTESAELQRAALVATGQFVKDKDTLAAAMEKIDGAIEAAKRTARILGDLSGCNPHDLADTAIKKTCPLIDDAVVAKESIPELEASKAALEATRADVEAKRIAAVAASKRHSDHVQARPNPNEATEEMNEIKAAIAVLEGEIANTPDRTQKAGFEAKIRSLAATKPRERAAAIEAQIANYQAIVDMKQRAGDALLSAQAAHAAAVKQYLLAKGVHDSLQLEKSPSLADTQNAIAGQRSQIQQNDSLLRVARENLEESAGALAGVAKELEMAEEAAKQVGILTAKRSTQEARDTALRAYRSAVSRQGIPFLILERALPLLEERANFYLAGTEKRIQIRSSADQNDKNDVVVQFSDDLGVHDRSESSGFDKSILGIAMRRGLADVAATFQGTTIRHVIQDESFGAYDQSNLLHGQVMMRQMAEGLHYMMFISHIPAINEVADTHLTVVRDVENGSRLEGPGTEPWETSDLFAGVSGEAGI